MVAAAGATAGHCATSVSARVCGSALGYSLLVVVGWVLGQSRMLSDRLLAILLVVSLMNAVLAPLAVRVLRWAWNEDERTRSYGGVSYGQ